MNEINENNADIIAHIFTVINKLVKELGIGKRNMIDYNSLDLDAVLIDFNKVESGELKKKDVLKKYGLNQHSLKVIKKLKNIS